jgi:hypothetical protein
MEEHLMHQNAAKAIDVYIMGEEAFSVLLEELGLQDSMYVAK